jgi:signal transduction histidine kinase
LLTLSRADAGQVRLAQEPVDLLSLARDVAAHLEDLAQEKGQSLHVEASATAGVRGDRVVLRQALINVVDNAIKYSPQGLPIHIRVDRNGERSWISVTDQGPGIAPEHRDRVFERFYCVDKSRSRELGGTGLGLSLARWAIEAHRGHIELESSVGGGSTFRLVLPSALSPAAG